MHKLQRSSDNVNYEEALNEWQNDPSNPLFEPPANDMKKRAAR
jgi:hypothetical protein